jgi:hypothetical protein
VTYRWFGDGVRWSEANLFSTFPRKLFRALLTFSSSLQPEAPQDARYNIFHAGDVLLRVPTANGRADFEAIRIVRFDNPVVSRARIFANYERRQVTKGIFSRRI